LQCKHESKRDSEITADSRFQILSASAPIIANFTQQKTITDQKLFAKTTHPMTSSASSERLHKQFCQTHILTIDRPERRQRSRHGTSDRSTRDIKNQTHIDSPQNFYNAPDQLVPVDEQLATAVTAQTTRPH